ncbi:MAG: hypothetical protein ACRDJ1_13375 [Actinomycetota bacterium]
MRSEDEVTSVLSPVASGLNVCQISRATGIRWLFTDSCDQLGIEWRQMNARNISVARRDSVALMDTFIGPKT